MVSMRRDFSYTTLWISYFCQYLPKNSLNVITCVPVCMYLIRWTVLTRAQPSFYCLSLFFALGFSNKFHMFFFPFEETWTNSSLYSHAVEILVSHPYTHTHTLLTAGLLWQQLTARCRSHYIISQACTCSQRSWSRLKSVGLHAHQQILPDNHLK